MGNPDPAPKRLEPGTRVQLHPATDLWMRGARYGTIVRYSKYDPADVRGVKYRVHVDRLGKDVWVRVEDLTEVPA